MMAFGENKEGALSRQKNFKQYLRSYALVIIFLGVCAVFAIASPTFLQPTNIVGVFRQIAINGVLALGMTLVIITGGIDLSVGSLMAITGVVSAMILESNPNMLAVALIVGIGAAALMSMWTAVLVAKMKIAAFIASLSTMTIARGVALVVADGIPHTIKDTTYSEIGNGYLWDPAATGGVGFPVLVLILIVVAVITAVILYNTKFGRRKRERGRSIRRKCRQGEILDLCIKRRPLRCGGYDACSPHNVRPAKRGDRIRARRDHGGYYRRDQYVGRQRKDQRHDHRCADYRSAQQWTGFAGCIFVLPADHQGYHYCSRSAA